MTFYEWVRQCLLWDARQKVLPEKQKAAARERAIALAEMQTRKKGVLLSPAWGKCPRQ